MKKISVAMVTGIFMVLSIFRAIAQVEPEVSASTIPPYSLAVTTNKTTSLIFPYAIKSIDRGSRDILCQKAIGVENILQVKAAKQGFAETNLTVVTADGSLYGYTVTYTDSPLNFSLLFSKPHIIPRPVAVFTGDATTDEVAQKALEVAGKAKTVSGIRDEHYDIAMEVKGLYIHEDVIYFQLGLRNTSAIDYDVQSLRFFIRDKKKSRRTASQEIELSPIYIFGNTQIIRHVSEQSVGIALPKFTIPDKKSLVIQLMEKGGGRHLQFKVSNKDIIRAKRAS